MALNGHLKSTSPHDIEVFKFKASYHKDSQWISKVGSQGQIIGQGKAFCWGAYIELGLKLKLPMFDSWIVPPSIAIEKRGILRDSVITAAFLIFSLW